MANLGHVAPDTPGVSVIFYNAYFAPDNEENGLRIVKEQLDQIAAKERPEPALDLFTVKERSVHVYFNTIGSPVLSPTFLHRLCSPRNITCTLLNHYKEAHEEVTLQKLYDFCHAAKDSTRVTYIHNKGSLNSHGGTNELWRRHLTAAAISNECWDPPEDACNVCGLQFWPVWTTFFPGNMWTAKCDYVSKLLPPIGFEAKMKSMYHKAMTLQQTGALTNGMFPTKRNALNDDSRGFFGVERFALEHWVGSHPSIRPCDVAGDFAGNLTAWNQPSGGANESDFVWNMAPHAPVRPVSYWWPLSESKIDQVMAHKGRRFREYFLLPGQLYKWIYLYNETPPIDSWALSWYPDRVEWRQRVEELGINVLDSIKP
jgi:hypothetical protein